jgi:hypothetical protein
MKLELNKGVINSLPTLVDIFSNCEIFNTKLDLVHALGTRAFIYLVIENTPVHLRFDSPIVDVINESGEVIGQTVEATPLVLSADSMKFQLLKLVGTVESEDKPEASDPTDEPVEPEPTPDPEPTEPEETPIWQSGNGVNKLYSDKVVNSGVTIYTLTETDKITTDESGCDYVVRSESGDIIVYCYTGGDLKYNGTLYQSNGGFVG